MPRWLSIASKSRRRREPEISQSFEIRCVCGELLQGQRRPRPQEVVCEQCGDPTFVLPLDTYPQMVVPGAKTKSFAAESEAPATATEVPEPETTAAEPPPLVEVKAGMLRRRKSFEPLRLLTPFRLVILAVVMMLGGTGYWMFRTSQISQAESALSALEERAITQLKVENFDAAAREFQKAVAALDVIGNDDPHARWVRQMHRETVAAARLAPDSLFEVVHQAEQWRHKPGRGTEAWRDYFRATYGETWMVLETTLWSVDDVEDPHYRIDIPLVMDGTPVRIETDSKLLADLPVVGESYDAIVAVQLKDCWLDRSTQQSWVVELDAETAFLWSDSKNYAALGFQADDLHTAEKTDQLLGRQSELLGIERLDW